MSPQPNVPTNPAVSLQTLTRRAVVNKVAIAASSLSVVTALVAFYYFVRMEKRYRHQLIIINVFGDLIRAACYLVFCILYLLGRAPPPGSPLCEAIGYFLSIGHELTDFTVLFIAIHGAIQVYRPIVDPQDPRYGLNPYRKLIGFILFLVPNLLAGLPYVARSGRASYANGGSICWLPVRPLWFRLGLSWIPRYIIIIVILTLSFVVYCHVDQQFNAFQQLWAFSKKPPSIQLVVSAEEDKPPGRRPSKVAFADGDVFWVGPITRADAGAGQRRASMPEPRSALKKAVEPHQHSFQDTSHRKLPRPLRNISSESPDVRNMWLPFSVGGFFQDAPVCSRKNSTITWSTTESKNSASTMPASLPIRGIRCLVSTFKSRSNSQTNKMITDVDAERSLSTHSAEQVIEAKRQTIMFQLRMNFVYPVMYVVMWIIPSILHGMQYSDKFATDPPMVLAAMATFCIASMGWINCTVFLLREMPWKGLKATSPSTYRCWPETTKTSSNKARISEPDYFSPAAGTNASDSLTPGTTSSSAKKSSSSRTTVPRKVHRVSNPLTSKSRATQRLQLERDDRTDEITGTVSPIALIGKHGVGQQRNWWDDKDFQSSTS